jgi:hypothetical protein
MSNGFMIIVQSAAIDLNSLAIGSDAIDAMTLLEANLRRWPLASLNLWPDGLDQKAMSALSSSQAVSISKYSYSSEAISAALIGKDRRSIQFTNFSELPFIGRYATADDRKSTSFIENRKLNIRYEFVEGNKIRNRMIKLCKYITNSDGRSSMHKAIYGYIDFLLIHPFYDGNGRTARALFQSILIIDGIIQAPVLPIGVPILMHKQQFLQGYYDIFVNNDANRFIIDFCKCVNMAMKIAESQLSSTINGQLS